MTTVCFHLQRDVWTKSFDPALSVRCFSRGCRADPRTLSKKEHHGFQLQEIGRS
jgi:hypothetical protein